MSTLDRVDTAKKATTRESRYNSTLATISVVYLLVFLAFFFWALLDAWTGQNDVLKYLGFTDKEIQKIDMEVYGLVALTVLAGGLGGIINGLRSFLQHGPVFDGRFTWKYITLPWLGTTNALFVYALINSGLAIFGGSGAAAGTGSGQVVAMFSVGVLAGYGSHDVFLWLDAQVTKLFKYEVMVPNLRNQSVSQAEKALCKARLELGAVTEEEQDNVTADGKVIRQEPQPGSIIDRGSAVNITLALPRRLSLPPVVDANDRLPAGTAALTNGQPPPQLDNIPQPAG